MKEYLLLWAAAIWLGGGILYAGVPGAGENLQIRAKEIAQSFLIIDTHIDAPLHQIRDPIDLTEETGRHFDYPRAKAGGLNASFMSIYISPSYQDDGAKERGEALIGVVESMVKQWPDKFAIATSPDDIRRQAAEGLLSLPMGMENGAPLEGDLDNLRYFYDRGIRYITLTHAKVNHICDSSYDTTRIWNGLSPFGKRLIPAMNRTGMIIDISHVTDSTFYQVIDLSQAPVIASHSACRHFTPGFERNMSDDMIRQMAENGGVIQMNFGSYFLTNAFRIKGEKMQADVGVYLEEHNLEYSDAQAQEYIREYKVEHDIHDADISEVLRQIEYVVDLVGIDHVGIGSDYDGVGSVPIGLENVSKYPNLIAGLLERGYSKQDIRKICGENFLRVWEEINRVASDMQGE